MKVFSYHLVKLPLSIAIKGLFANLINKNTLGLMYVQYSTSMVLGTPIFSLSRFLIRDVAIFAQWENEDALNHFMKNEKLGQLLTKGWHIRLQLVRDWGEIKNLKIPNEKATLNHPESPVVAITIARMKPLEIPRFLRWGRPVEKLVRDHHSANLSHASFRFPNTISTFSIWKNVKEMTDMTHGNSNISQPKRHSNAMKERERKNFHFEFVTLRFKPISEHGAWKGKTNYSVNFDS